MKDKNILKNLVKEYQHIKNNSNKNKCVGFGFQNSNQYYFSLSGANRDYDGSISNIRTSNNNFKKIQNELIEFMTGKKRNVVLASLGDSCESYYLNINNINKITSPINFYSYYHKYHGTPTYSGRTFSCVERKIIFSGFKNKRQGTIYVSVDPCKLCDPFLKNIRIVTL